MQFGAKPLFENVSVKFNGGNRYGLIGANGCGKSTFMKILGGDLEPSGGQVMLEPNVRLGKLRQDQFAYEEFTVIDTVIMGHEELWKQIDKIQLAEVKPSSRVSPFIRFEQTKKLHRQAVTIEQMSKGFDGKTLFKNFSFTDHAHDFEDDVSLFDWMGQWTQGEQIIRGTLGRMLFSNDEILKSVKVISGGEQGRMLPNGVTDFSGTYDDYLRSQGVVF
eukprot:gene3584-3505_t